MTTTARGGLMSALALALVAVLQPVAAATPPTPADEAARPAAQPVAADDPATLLVTTDGSGPPGHLQQVARRAAPGAAVRPVSDRVARVRTSPARQRAAAAALLRQPGVVAVEPVRYRRLLQTPDDPLYPRQWAHGLTAAPAAWETTTGSADVTVAVLDNGVDARHPDLRVNVQEQRVFAGSSSYALVNSDSDNRQCPVDEGGDHGTHVAGIVGAAGNDGTGVAGVSWRVRLLDYAVFQPVDGECGASDADVLDAMVEAAAAGADVINLSLGGFGQEESCPAAFQSVIDDVRAAGAMVVAAAGNGEEDPASAGRPSVPASCNGVVSVGAVTRDGQHAPYSTTNEHVDLVAPGGDSRTGFADGILSTVGDGAHDWLEGTSMAAPYVSGAAALIRSVAPELSPDHVEGVLESTARDFGPEGRDPAYGWGLLHVGEAVASAAAGDQPSPQADPLFPVGAAGEDTLRPPPDGQPAVYRVSAGTGTTSAASQAVAMSRVTFPQQGAAHAVLARSDGFADALSGSSLTLGVGPLLFSGSTGPLPATTRQELQRVLPPGGTVYLLGGPAALPPGVESELRVMGLRPQRLEGRNREETAVAVAKELAARRSSLGFPDPGTALLATAGDWPDAVTSGAMGAFYGIPILLTPPASLHPATAAYLRDLRPAVLYVAGGPAAVSDPTARAAVKAAGATGGSRVAGADRYGTAIELAQLFGSLLERDAASVSCVVAVNVVRADGFAHALSASPLAGGYGCVMVPVDGAAGDRLPDATRIYVYGAGVDGIVVGDVDVVSEAAAQDLAELLAG